MIGDDLRSFRLPYRGTNNHPCSENDAGVDADIGGIFFPPSLATLTGVGLTRAFSGREEGSLKKGDMIGSVTSCMALASLNNRDVLSVITVGSILTYVRSIEHRTDRFVPLRPRTMNVNETSQGGKWDRQRRREEISREKIWFHLEDANFQVQPVTYDDGMHLLHLRPRTRGGYFRWKRGQEPWNVNEYPKPDKTRIVPGLAFFCWKRCKMPLRWTTNEFRHAGTLRGKHSCKHWLSPLRQNL